MRWTVADRDAAAEAARDENANLKKAVADLSLDGDASGRPPEDFEACPAAQAVDAVCGEWDVSIIRCAYRRRRAEPSVAPAL